MRSKPPATLTDRLSVTQLSDVSQWWLRLAPGERRSLRRLLADDATGPAARGRVLGQFVDALLSRENGNNPELGTTDFYEYLVNHELTLEDGRTFHICSAHAEARAVLTAGEIPADFRCPRADAHCPMRAILDLVPDSKVRLSLVREEACR